MKNKISVLLTAAGGIHTLGVIDCLKKNFERKDIRIICTDIIDQPILRYKADEFYIVPKGNSKYYLKKILRICKKEKIKIIIPGNGMEILSIAKNLEFFKKNQIKPTISGYDSIKIMMDKEKTYRILKKVGVNVPEFIRVKDYDSFKKSLKKLNFPKNEICFKPSRYSKSGGARGFRILRKNNSLNDIILNKKPDSVEIDFETTKRMFKTNKKIDLLMMEYLPGEEYSVYVFAMKGKMIYCVSNIREKLKEHYSFEARTIKNQEIFDVCKKIVEELKLDYNINIQFRKSIDGKMKLIEINPRIGGTVILPAVAGVNLPYFAVKYALGEKVPQKCKIKLMRMIRYWKEMYVSENQFFEINSNSRI